MMAYNWLGVFKLFNQQLQELDTFTFEVEFPKQEILYSEKIEKYS